MSSGWQFMLSCIGPPSRRLVREWTFRTFSDQLDECERLFFEGKTPPG